MIETEILIIGAGFAGLGTAIQLKRNGIDDFILLERAEQVGGVWRDNRYPGCACDVQSHLYSFSFAPNPAWSHAFSRQAEIWAYLQQCASDFAILPHIRFNQAVQAAVWDEMAQRWQVETAQGRFSARLLVSGAGGLSEPSIPVLSGGERFAGPAFHSAHWQHEINLAGKQIAVIGTGASAIQFIPEIQLQVAQLTVYQRTAAWVLPRPDRPLSLVEQRLFARFPQLQRLLRAWVYGNRELFGAFFRHPKLIEISQQTALEHMAQAISDPALRAKLIPNYTIGCKRILISDDYYPALAQPNVELVTAGIAEVREQSIVDTAGVERPIDIIIYGTGFRVTDQPIMHQVRGHGGQTLAEAWQGSPKAHLGTTVHGFPNLFLLQGPNTGLGHTSVLYMIEAQIMHVVRAAQYMRQHGLAAIEPRAEAQAAFVREVDRKMVGTVWTAGGCRSWYLDRTGRNSTIWPDFTWRFHRRVSHFAPSEYLLR